ncbi:hypothetical protein DICVIV_10295 [Dictyocaulus viviparus]|uniref:G-protein coupled receptors family 1 profile domain-containing protein n=1 Tax=Dictyocaulus viviparus TaxID=29172 RepID=A0A0D8XMU4_DICVI|nr:hypothetical protein DICVIV_10295 [Dictyocaulus viviparus]
MSSLPCRSTTIRFSLLVFLDCPLVLRHRLINFVLKDNVLMSDSYSEVPDMHYAKGVMTIVYIGVFLIGTPGNLWIIFKLIQTRLLSSQSIGLRSSQRCRIYVFALACSDLVLLLTLPLTASYNYKGTWIFGEFICYAHLTIEIVAKLFSVVLLTVMSLERYFIVCTRLRSACDTWMTSIPLVVGTLFCVVVPSTFHFFYIIHHQFTIPGMIYCRRKMKNKLIRSYLNHSDYVSFLIVIPYTFRSILRKSECVLVGNCDKYSYVLIYEENVDEVLLDADIVFELFTTMIFILNPTEECLIL